MNEEKAYWYEKYRAPSFKKPVYDLWLDKYDDILKTSINSPIIDLGCGFGNDTLYLHERGYEVISCDFSKEALEKVESFIEKPVTKLLDMREDLPFESASAKIVVADLSLHYFSWSETKNIINEIKRVLSTDGFLLARVNSVNDINYGAGQGTVVEENYYCVNGRFKRFFDKAHLEELFAQWEIAYLNEHELNRYKNSKVLWEIVAGK